MTRDPATFASRSKVFLLLCSSLAVTSSGMVGSAWADEDFPEPVPAVKTYELTVSAAKEPNPALKHRFVVPLTERHAGNAAVFYNRAIMDFLESGRKETEMQAWFELPLDKLPLDEVRLFVNQRQGLFGDIKTATTCDACDWGIRFQEMRGKEVVDFRLIEFQYARSLARLLRTKARLEIAEKRLDDAITTVGQIYQLSNDLAKAPNIIVNLVGIAVSSVAGETVIDLLAMENLPNLYWAFRALPDPLVNIQAAAHLESTMAVRVFPFLQDAETAQRSVDEWKQLLTEAFVQLGEWTDHPQSNSVESQALFTAMLLKNYPIAKRELISAGYDAQRIEQMPVGQVIAIYARDCYAHVSSETSKWLLVPFAQGYERQKQASQELIAQGYFGKPASSLPTHDPLMINTELSYASAQVLQASNRQRVLIAGLTAVEAIRMHAAANSGKPPASLEQITVVPVPTNPSTGKRPLYRVVNQRADLLIPPTDAGQEYSGRRFLVTIRPSSKEMK
ncbi:hypothetical protein [Schlesneria paludicola]|uniref:hypothetical protein n=1 Tax=Schlesneria paludicola TaxID=360056 RepID=UPI00029A6DBC|nr:hypothetical protein [Schlesneria paludicola]